MNVGLSQRVLYHKDRAHDSLEHNWYRFLDNHALFPIANRLDQNFDELADKLDVLILTGGDDSQIRHVTELKISTKMFERSKPILGICHGAFLLTELFDGEVKYDEKLRDIISHDVIYNGNNYTVNSFHTNYIDTISQNCKSLCTDMDGKVESWVHKYCNISTIVWHPERMDTPFIPDEIKEATKLWKT